MKGVKILTDKVQSVASTLRAMGQYQVLVGIPEDENERKEGDGLGNAELLYIHTNGSAAANIPATPVLEPGVMNVQDRLADIMGNAMKAALGGRGQAAVLKGFEKAGLVAQASARKVITDQQGFEPLAQGTLDARARKGFKGTKRLLRTGQLRNAITYVVRKRG